MLKQKKDQPKKPFAEADRQTRRAHRAARHAVQSLRRRVALQELIDGAQYN